MIKDGRRAFPMAVEVNGELEQGMTLRDYFAGQAVMGLMAGHNAIAMNDDNIIFRYPNAYAAFAYQLADALLAEREKKA